VGSFFQVPRAEFAGRRGDFDRDGEIQKATAIGSIPGSGLFGISRTQGKRVDEPF
jgi:hypothetical protein